MSSEPPPPSSIEPAELTAALKALGFHVVPTGVVETVPSPEVRAEVRRFMGRSDLAALLVHYPPLFLMPADPSARIVGLFAVPIPASGELSPAAEAVYRTYFPPELITVRPGPAGAFQVRWFGAETPFQDLRSFAVNELGMRYPRRH